MARGRVCWMAWELQQQARTVRAPRGSEISCKGWQQEAALRMLMNNLDPEVAEHPEDLVVYGGTGRAARSWEAFDAIVATLRTLENDETMLVQSGKPVGVFRTHEWAPRVLIANSNLVGDWANWEKFRELEAAGPDDVRPDDRRLVDLHRHPGHPAGHLRDVRCGGAKAFARHPGRHHHPDRGPRRHGRRATAGGHDERRRRDLRGLRPEPHRPAHRPALPRRQGRQRSTTRCKLAVEARDAKRPLSIGLLGNAAEVFPELLERGAPIDIVTDQTSAHDPLSYLPIGVEFDDMKKMADKDPAYFTEQAEASMAKHVAAMVGFMDKGAEVFDYGNSIRDEARKAGYDRAFDFPGFVPAYIRPQFEEGLGPFRWAALSGDPKDIEATDRACWNCSRTTSTCGAGSPWRRRRSPTRACPPASAGSATASGTRPGCASTRWWPTVRCRRRS